MFLQYVRKTTIGIYFQRKILDSRVFCLALFSYSVSLRTAFQTNKTEKTKTKYIDDEHMEFTNIWKNTKNKIKQYVKRLASTSF